MKIDLFTWYVLFPNSGHVIILWRTVSFKFLPIHVHMYAQCMKRQRVKFPWDLYWENKTYKLKRSIEPVNTYNVRFGGGGGRGLPGGVLGRVQICDMQHHWYNTFFSYRDTAYCISLSVSMNVGNLASSSMLKYDFMKQGLEAWKYSIRSRASSSNKKVNQA